jgi:hypothetical protein
MGNHHGCCNHRHGGWGVFRIIGMAIGGVCLAIVFGFLFGWFVEHLWNWLMPQLFGLKLITFWQGFGLVVLAKLLFGAIGGHHDKAHRKWSRHYGHNCGDDGDDDHCDDLWKIRASHKDWKLYKQYWKEEGKTAFEAYLDKMQNRQ